jgi:hypothetical protein
MATKDETQRETTKGYSGDPVMEGEGEAPAYSTKLPEGSVISPVGVTRPPEPGILDPYRKTRSKDEQLAGKILIKGKTHHGYCYQRIVDILQPRTAKGMFQVFKAHFPDAVEEDFSAEAVSDEDAEKLEKEWAKEMMGKEKEESDKKRREYEGGSSSAKKEPEDYDAYTVAELKELSAQRNIETRHDWTKDDYVKALKKGDKHG